MGCRMGDLRSGLSIVGGVVFSPFGVDRWLVMSRLLDFDVDCWLMLSRLLDFDAGCWLSVVIVD